MHRFFVVFPLIFLAGCSKSGEPTAPPAQEAPVRKASAPTKEVITMGDPAALDYIVKDVSDSLEGGKWRWTFEKPELQFALKSTDKKKFEADYSVSDATFKDTGPVTVKFVVNGHDLGSAKYPKAGEYHFAKAVPAAWLSTDGLTKVAINVSPLWTAPGDGKHLGLIFVRAGFVSE